MRKQRGFSLFELLLVLAITLAFALSAVLLGREQLIRLRLLEARIALAQNARALENWQQQQQSLGMHDWSAKHWPALPVANTGFYRIEFTAKFQRFPGRYRLRAVPMHRWLGEQYLLMDQDGQITDCVDSSRYRYFCGY